MARPKKIRTREELFMKLLTEYEESEDTVIGEFSLNIDESRKSLDKEIEWYKSEWQRLKEVRNE